VDLRGAIRRAIETIQPQVNRKEQSLVELLPEEPLERNLESSRT
jgi:hypothetical protein